MRFLASDNLAEQVLPDRLGKERIARASDDGKEPGQHQQREPDNPDQRFERQQPAGGTIDHDQRDRRQPNDHHDERPLQQHTDGKRAPEHPRQYPCASRFEPLALIREIRPRHGTHGGDDGQEQHGIGLGDKPFDAKQHAACHHETGEHRGAARDEGKRRPIRQKNRTDGADQRGHAIEPNRGEGPLEAERARELHHSALQPVDPHGLFVAHLVLEADVDVIAALHHLLGGLREARLVTIEGRDAEEAGQEAQQRNQQQERDGALMRTDCEVDDRLEAARRRQMTPLVIGCDYHVPCCAAPCCDIRV